MRFFVFPVVAIFTGTVIAVETGTGGCKPVTWENENSGDATAPAIPRPTITRRNSIKLGAAEVGQINCRYTTTSDETVDSNTCSALATFYSITVEKLLWLNPILLKGGCEDITPNTVYCVAGFIEPLRAHDGKCGPPNKNATCVGVDMGQCCNSQTWTCGEKYADCEPGNCYEGVCWGHKIYTTDGTCGYQNGNRFCAGRWGNCCNLEGVCGTGEAFCGVETGQSCTRLRGLPHEWGWKLWTD